MDPDPEVQLVHIEPTHEVEIETIAFDPMKGDVSDLNLDFDGNCRLSPLVQLISHWLIQFP